MAKLINPGNVSRKTVTGACASTGMQPAPRGYAGGLVALALRVNITVSITSRVKHLRRNATGVSVRATVVQPRVQKRGVCHQRKRGAIIKDKATNQGKAFLRTATAAFAGPTARQVARKRCA